MSHRTLLPLSVLVLLSGSGCGTDYLAETDHKVTQKWMQQGNYTDAIEYLETGGRYYNPTRMSGLPDLDKEAIVPLLKDLKKEFGEEQYAILLEDEDYAWSIVMKLPSDEPGRKRFRTYFEEVRQTFPGMILEEWGYEWITFHFLDEQEAKFIRDADAEAAAS